MFSQSKKEHAQKSAPSFILDQKQLNNPKISVVNVEKKEGPF